jgi:hypothetical protein
MKWINPKEQKPELNIKVIIAAPNYTAIGYWDGEKWFRWIDFPTGNEPFKSKEENMVFAWQPLPDWKHSDFNWL